jgi:outer membrane receptor protein involved in Fe transport
MVGWEMLPHRRSVRFMAALAGGLSGFALAYTHPAVAQQADQPTAEAGGLQEIVVAAHPNNPASVELVKGPQDTLSGTPTNGGATVAEPKIPASGLEGFIEGSVGSYGQRSIGGAVTIPLVQDKLTLHVEGYEAHFGTR